MSAYSLGMIYPSWEAGAFYSQQQGIGYVPPLFVALTRKPYWYAGDDERWFRIAPWCVRFPSWVARKLLRRNPRGQIGEPTPMPWKPVRRKYGNTPQQL